VVDSAKLNTKDGIGVTLIQDRDARMRGEGPHRIGFGRTRPVKIHQTIMGTLAQESIWKDRIQSFSNQLHDQIVMCRSNLSPSSLLWQ